MIVPDFMSTSKNIDPWSVECPSRPARKVQLNGFTQLGRGSVDPVRRSSEYLEDVVIRIVLSGALSGSRELTNTSFCRRS